MKDSNQKYTLTIPQDQPSECPWSGQKSWWKKNSPLVGRDKFAVGGWMVRFYTKFAVGPLSPGGHNQMLAIKSNLMRLQILFLIKKNYSFYLG